MTNEPDDALLRWLEAEGFSEGDDTALDDPWDDDTVDVEGLTDAQRRFLSTSGLGVIDEDDLDLDHGTYLDS